MSFGICISSSIWLILVLTFVPTGLCALIIKKQFPHVEVHEHEMQKFNMDEYFSGNSLSFSIPPEHKSPHVFFTGTQTVCTAFFALTLTHAFRFSPSSASASDSSFLFWVSSDLSVAKAAMVGSCPDFATSLSLPAMARRFGYELLAVRSLVVGMQNQEIVCYLQTVVRRANCTSCGQEDVIISFEWGILNHAEAVNVAAAGSLRNATLLFHGDMLVAYYKCTSREHCAENSKGKNAVYVYQLKGEKLGELAPYLVARLDAEFFHKTSIKVSEVHTRTRGLMICDIENNVVYSVDISTANRVPVLAQNYTFTTRVDSIAASFPGNNPVTYVSSRLAARRSAELYEIYTNHIHGVYYSALPWSSESDSQDYVTDSTCNTKSMHFTLFHNGRTGNDYQIRIFSPKRNYLEIMSVPNSVLIMDCVNPKEDYVLLVTVGEYAVYQYQFPQLVVDYTHFESTLSVPMHHILNFTVTSEFDSENHKRWSIQRELVVYPLRDLSPSIRVGLKRVYDIHGYKGDMQTLTLANIYGGIVPALERQADKNLYRRLVLSSRWIEFSKFTISGEQDPHWQLVLSARDDNLMFKMLSGYLYAFAFTRNPEDPVKAYCFLASLTRRTLRDCPKGAAFPAAGVDPPVNLQGNTITTTAGSYLTFSREQGTGQYALTLYRWVKSRRGLLWLRKYVTHAFEPEDQMVSMALYDNEGTRVLFVYGNSGRDGVYSLFRITETLVRFQATFRYRQVVAGMRIIKLACLRNVTMAVALCEKDGLRSLQLISFLQIPIFTTTIQVEGETIDFLARLNDIVVFTSDGRIFYYTISRSDAILVKEIPLPVDCTLAKRAGLPLYNSEVTRTHGRALLALILVAGQARGYRLYVVDIEEFTHFAPVIFLDLDLDPAQPIHGVYTRYEAETNLVFIVTDSCIKPFAIRPDSQLLVSAISELPSLRNATFSFFPKGRNDLNITMRYWEAETTLSIYGDRARNDTLHAITGNFSFPLAAFVRGFSLSHQVSVIEGSPMCRAWVDDSPELVQEVKYQLNSQTFMSLTGSKLYLADSENNLYIMNYNFNRAEEVVSGITHVPDVVSYTMRSAFRTMQIAGEGTYIFTMNNVTTTAGSPSLQVFNDSFALIYWSAVSAKGNLKVVSSEVLKAFVWIHTVDRSFYGQAIMLFGSYAQAYHFNSRDLGCDETSEFRCDMNPGSDLLYCTNYEGTVHAILMGREKAKLVAKTHLFVAAVHFPFATWDTTLGIRDIIAVSTKEVLLSAAIGFIRCWCGRAKIQVISCYRKTNNTMLNVIPRYDQAEAGSAYATDGRVLAVRLKDRTYKKFHVIRIINLLSPFDRTEVFDIPIGPKETTLESFAVDSTAFDSHGALFVYFEKTALRIYRFPAHRSLNVYTEGAQCRVRVQSRSTLGTRSEFNLTIQTTPKVRSPISILGGVWLCLFGFGGLIVMTRHYYSMAEKRKKTSHEEEDSRTVTEEEGKE